MRRDEVTGVSSGSSITAPGPAARPCPTGLPGRDPEVAQLHPVLPVSPVLVVLVLVPVSTVKPDNEKVSFWPPVEQISQPSLSAVQVLAAGR
jgi:hypothetical protein